MALDPVTRALPDGLALRTARPHDLDQIAELLAARGDPDDAVDHRLVVLDPDLGWESCAVVVAGDRVVSTATLLDETLRVGEVVLPAGQVELVATDVAYEGRGLVRELMAWAHQRSAQRGQLLQVMIGIPYFYRRFGYEYAIDIPPARLLLPSGDAPAPSPLPGSASAAVTLRAARPDDLAALAALQDAAQAGVDLAMPHPAARWRWLLGHTATRTMVLERAGAVVGSARVRDDGEELLLAEPTAADATTAGLLLGLLVAEREGVSVVHRSGTVTAGAWEPRLAPAAGSAEQYYVRLPDAAAVLDALRPLLHRRVLEAGIERFGSQIVVSTFGAHYRMAVTEAGLGPVHVGGPMQSPGSVGGIGVAPDHLAALLFGSRGLSGLSRVRPDVYAPDEALADALFPSMTGDLLTYYLPW